MKARHIGSDFDDFLAEEGLLAEVEEKLARWQTWLVETDALVAETLARRKGETIAVDDLLAEDRKELEERTYENP